MNFYLPTRLLTGRGVVAENAARIAAFGLRCLLVTGPHAARRCGALADVTAALDSGGVAWQLFDQIQPNPSIFSCVEGGHLAHAFGADFILGIGGGSALDAAKIIAVSAANPELDAAGLYTLDWPNPPLPIVLVGTTAGTGSEVTPVAVITAQDGRKRSFHSEKLYAALSLGDPAYTASMPLSVTASTGVDALAHCLESYYSCKANAVSRACALQGISLLLPPLRKLLSGELPDTLEREALYTGSLLGGMAISVTGTVFPHNMGYYLTETHGIPHGFACAAFLPALLRHEAKCSPACAAALYTRCGTDSEDLAALIEALTPDHGVRLSEAELLALLPRWDGSPSIRKTLDPPDREQLLAILRAVLGQRAHG